MRQFWPMADRAGRAGPNLAVTAVASADGSVTVTFAGLPSGSDPAATISGSADFACKGA